MTREPGTPSANTSCVAVRFKVQPSKFAITAAAFPDRALLPQARELNFPPRRGTCSPGRAEGRATQPRDIAGDDWRIASDTLGAARRSASPARLSANRLCGASSSASVTPARIHQWSASMAWRALNGRSVKSFFVEDIGPLT